MKLSRYALLLFPLLVACGETTIKPSKAIVNEYKQADSPQVLSKFVRRAVPNTRVPIVYFYADWCEPCRRFRAALPSAQVEEALQRAAIIKVNVDICQELAAYYGVTAVPTFIKTTVQGQPVAKITSTEWGDDEPAVIAPVMAKLANTTSYDLKP